MSTLSYNFKNHKWPSTRLGDHVLKVGSGITPRGGQSVYNTQKGIPFIRSQNVQMNSFCYDGLAFISEEQDAEMTQTRVCEGDVLLNITGASIGRTCVVPKEICPANVNQHVSIIRSDGTIEPEFISFYISSPDFQEFIMASQSGATRQALTKTMIEDFVIPFPLLEVQRHIINSLKHELALIGQARHATEAQLEAAQALPAAYLREVFESPEAREWPKKRLGELCQLLASRSISTIGDVRVQAITTACLSELGFQPAGVKPARMMAEDAMECKISSGEILIARSNTPDLVGRVSIYGGTPEELVASDLTIRVLSGPRIHPGFLNSYLSYLYVTGYWRERAGGASGSMKKITRSMIMEQEIPLPSSEDQNKIATNLNQKMIYLGELLHAIEKQDILIQTVPTAILRQAFNGEL